jgi:leader peptidase (prepilin peptidase)/N-methyltransferase
MTARTFLSAAVGIAAFALAGEAANASGLAVTRLAVCGAALGIAAATDVVEHRVPNRVVLPAALVCAALTVLDGSDLRDAAGGLALVALLLAVGLARPDALGMGDVKLALLIAVGLDGTASRALLLGLLLAAIGGLLLIALHGRRAWRRSLPLTPFLATGALAALLL